MRRIGYVVISTSVAMLLPGHGRAQTTPSAAVVNLDAVVQELRLLRRAVERQNSSVARTQLLLARLSLQDQRLARSRQSVERLEGELANAEREQTQLQSAARELGRALEQATEDGHRKGIEQESRLVRSRLTVSSSALQDVNGRLTQARQLLDSDTARYDELEAWLADLERELQRAGS